MLPQERRLPGINSRLERGLGWAELSLAGLSGQQSLSLGVLHNEVSIRYLGEHKASSAVSIAA